MTGQIEAGSAIGIAGYYHLLLFGLFVPYLAVKSARRIKQVPLPPPRRHLPRVLILQVMMAAISIGLARATGVELFAAPAFRLGQLVVGALVLGAIIAVSWPRWERRVVSRERRVYLTMPRSSTERFLWASVSLAAGIGEEISSRGVFTSLLARLVPLEVAVPIAVAAFTVAHAGRGWRDLTFIAVSQS